MPPLDANDTSAPETAGQRLAILAEALYLANLLLLPGIAFIALATLYMKQRPSTPPLSRCHLLQTMSASLWAGLLLCIVSLLIILLGGLHSPYTWMVVIIYFTTCHTTLVLLGIVGLARAMAGKQFHYPLIGRRCSEQ